MFEQYSSKLIQAALLEPVTLVEVKTHSKIAWSVEDDLINGYIASARDLAQKYTGRQFVNATWRMWFDEWPEIIEPRPTPLVSVTTLKYVDEDGEQQTLSTSLYQVSAASGRIAPAYGESWPTARTQLDAIELTFVAGYGVPAEVPPAVKEAILLQTGFWILNREAPRDDLSPAVKALLDTAWDGKY